MNISYCYYVLLKQRCAHSYGILKMGDGQSFYRDLGTYIAVSISAKVRKMIPRFWLAFLIFVETCLLKFSA